MIYPLMALRAQANTVKNRRKERIGMDDVHAYQGELNFKGEKGDSRDFRTGGEPEEALDQAKNWVEAEIKHYLQANRSVLTNSWWAAGNVTAILVDSGATDEPAETLRCRLVNAVPVLEWG
jgi:hypothetical protein